ncbi:hypothetical protein [Nocardiopsis ganjiahuensis]|uniref:hypothetical protein n=1 Tax=Nocardiopsis ganjiahuensis TaxID=239984 RepID=UPI0003470157|nr:hypothetical protein [Nocardiopsis ganjiahuensis]
MSVPLSARPEQTRSGEARHTFASRTPYWAALAWSAAALGLALGWLAGVVPPGLSESGSFGGLLTTENLGAAVAATAVMGALGVGLALLLPRGVLPRALEVPVWALIGALLVTYIDSTLLVWLGYGLITPVLVWFEPAMGAAYVTYTFSAAVSQVLFFVLGTGIWAWVLVVHRRHRLQACVRCGRAEGWTPEAEREVRGRALRTGRIAVACAIALALFYPALRIPWLFGFSMGMDAEAFQRIQAESGTLMIGVGLGSAGILGAVLMLGLVQGWGVRFPRWMVGLAGRRVPVLLAVVPAMLVATALVGMGRSIVVQTWHGGGIEPEMVTHLVAFGSMPLWAAALTAATAAYAVRRRAECGACGRGLPEAWPVAAPPVLSRRR